jgi:hypothetical protein
LRPRTQVEQPLRDQGLERDLRRTASQLATTVSKAFANSAARECHAVDQALLHVAARKVPETELKTFSAAEQQIVLRSG